MSKLAELIAKEEGLPVVKPSLPLDYLGDLLLANTILCGKRFADSSGSGSVLGPDLGHFFGGEFGGYTLSAVLPHHFLIIRVRHPGQIFKPIISWIAIQMSNIGKGMRVWQESERDESMHQPRMLDVGIRPYVDTFISTLISGLRDLSLIYLAPNAAAWMRFVTERITRNLSPHMTPWGLK